MWSSCLRLQNATSFHKFGRCYVTWRWCVALWVSGWKRSSQQLCLQPFRSDGSELRYIYIYCIYTYHNIILYIYLYIATRWRWRYERVVWRKHIDKYALRLRREEMSQICVSFPKLSYIFMVNPIRPVYSCEYKPIAFLLPFRVIVSSSHLSLLFHGSFLHFCGQTKHFDILCTLHSGSDTSNDRAPRPPGAIAQPVITEGTDAATDASAAQGMAKKWGQRPTIPTNKRKVQEGPRRTLWQFLFKASESLGLILYSSVSDIFWIHRSASFGDETLARGDLLRPAITSRSRPRLSVVETKMWKRKDLKDSSVK